MNERDMQDLLHRLLRRCKYEPTIAEIMDEWKALKRARQPSAPAVVTPRVCNPAVMRRLKAEKEAIAAGTFVAKNVMTPVLAAYARQWLPDVTDEELRQNAAEIAAAYGEMRRECDANARYITGLIRHGGMILSCMRRRPS